MSEQIKKCSQCGKEKRINCFQFRNDKQKYRNECKNCFYNSRKKYAENHKKEIKQYQKIWHKNHKKEIKQYRKEYYQQNKEELKKKGKEYTKNNRKEISERRKLNKKHVYSRIRADALRRNYNFNLTFEEYIQLAWEKKCFYCGGKTVNGIDRINNNKGYVVGNIVPCCHYCNWMKLDKSTKDFILHIIKIIKHLLIKKYE